MRTVYISLGNENSEDNKVILNGKEIDISRVGYMLIEFTAGHPAKWIMANQPPKTEAIVLKTPLEVTDK